MKVSLDRYREKVNEIFNHLHTHPEVSWQEKETTNYIANMLQEYGCKVQRFDKNTGVVGEIGEGKPVIGLRADIDALWQEVDGTFRANHSCGHDAHTTMVLGAFLALKDMDLPKGTIKFIFQPAEEKGQGALYLVEKGAADHLDFLYGVHLRPVQELTFGKASPAIIHGAARLIEGKIIGEDAHGARPHLNVNAIEVGADIVQKLSHIYLDPMMPYSCKMTRFIAGGDNANIIPGNATFSIDLRAQTNEAMAELVKKVHQLFKSIKNYYGVEIEMKVGASIPAAEVDGEAKQYMEEAIKEVLGSNQVVPPLVTTGGDDFHFYTIKRPHIKAAMLGLGSDLKPGLHHPNMSFNHEVLVKGAEILAGVVIKTLQDINGR